MYYLFSFINISELGNSIKHYEINEYNMSRFTIKQQNFIQIIYI